MNSSTFSAQSVTKKFTHAHGTNNVLDEVSVTFEQNKTYAITGVSGTGKSTLLHLLAGLDVPTAGTILFNTTDIATFTESQKNKWLNQSIGLVFQSPYLIKELSVLENLMLPAIIGNKKQSDIEAQARNLLFAVGLQKYATYHPNALSGGQQQRVVIARALINKPTFLLADEPTGNLDVATGATIVDLLLQCQQDFGLGLIISSHDAYVSQSMQYVYEMKNGKLHDQ